jgi:hypothetical protein
MGKGGAKEGMGTGLPKASKALTADFTKSCAHALLACDPLFLLRPGRLLIERGDARREISRCFAAVDGKIAPPPIPPPASRNNAEIEASIVVHQKLLRLPTGTSIENDVSWPHPSVLNVTSRIFPAAVLTAALLIADAFLCAAVPDYKLGDIAEEDVITPVALVVPHPEATDALKQNVAQQAPSIVRFTPHSAAAAETELRAAVNSAHVKFMTALQAALQDRAPGESDIGTPPFIAAIEYVLKDSASNLPLHELVPFWLRRESDEPLVEKLLKPVREAMADPIISDSEADVPLPANQPVRLISVKSFTEPVTIDSFDSSGPTIAPAKLNGLWLAQRMVETHFPPGLEHFGKFSATFVRPNSFYDPALTEIVRAKRMVGFAVNDTFEPAQIIVHKGQAVDRRALSALAVLREKSLIGTLQTKLDQEQTVAGQIESQTTWIATGLGVMALALLLILWRLRTRPLEPYVPAFSNPVLAGVQQAALPDGDPESAWQSRALLAEGKVERAHAAIRSGALGWMRDKIFRTMANQRAELLSSQQHAEVEMRELEQRLEQLQTPLQEKLTSYEKRIHELEEELATKLKAHEAARAAAALATKPAENSPRYQEAILAERERSIKEAEVRLAERARDLAEMDALLRARESLLASAPIKPSGNGRVAVKGIDALERSGKA